MNDVQEELLSYDVNSSNIRKITKDIRIFFIWVFFTCICDALIYIYLFNTSSELLSGWFILTILFILSGFFSSTYLLQQNKVQEFKHLDLFFSVFLFDLRKLIWDWRLYHQFRIYDDAKCG